MRASLEKLKKAVSEAMEKPATTKYPRRPDSVRYFNESSAYRDYSSNRESQPTPERRYFTAPSIVPQREFIQQSVTTVTTIGDCEGTSSANWYLNSTQNRKRKASDVSSSSSITQTGYPFKVPKHHIGKSWVPVDTARVNNHHYVPLSEERKSSFSQHAKKNSKPDWNDERTLVDVDNRKKGTQKESSHRSDAELPQNALKHNPSKDSLSQNVDKKNTVSMKASMGDPQKIHEEARPYSQITQKRSNCDSNADHFQNTEISSSAKIPRKNCGTDKKSDFLDKSSAGSSQEKIPSVSQNIPYPRKIPNFNKDCAFLPLDVNRKTSKIPKQAKKDNFKAPLNDKIPSVSKLSNTVNSIKRNTSSQMTHEKNQNIVMSDLPYSITESRRLFMKDQISKDIHDFFLQGQQTELLLQKKNELTRALQNALNRAVFDSPNRSKLFIVGSSLNGFGRLTSDLDLCLVLDDMQERLDSRSRVMKTLRLVRDLLRQVSFASRIEIIPAKVPILRFHDSFSNVDCDINVNNLGGIRNTYLLKAYTNLDYRVRPLVLTVKEWAHQNDINDASKGTLSSYSIVLMVIHFLQCGVKPSLLPSLQVEYPELFNRQIPLEDVSRNVSLVRPYRSQNQMSLSELLLGFFRYFSKKFVYETSVMSIRKGKSCHVREVGNGREWENLIKIEEPYDRSNTARAAFNPASANAIIGKIRRGYNLLVRHRQLNCFMKINRRKNQEVIVLDD